jgi:hypothetical protein
VQLVAAMQMRMILMIGFTLAGLDATGSSAVAQPAGHPHHRYHHHYRHGPITYGSCRCYFGYEGSNDVCVPAASCYAEGGRCKARCPRQTGN